MNESPHLISVAILDDDPVLLECLGDRLAACPGFAPPKLFAKRSDAIAAVVRRPPDVMLVDLHLGDDSGLRFLRKVRTRGVRSMMLVLTNSADTEHILASFAAGADGYILKTCNQGELLETIRRVSLGEPAVTPEVLTQVLHQYRTRAESTYRPLQLTPRETEILHLLATGMPCGKIASHLGLSVHTIYNFNKSLCKKLGVRNRCSAVAWWRQIHGAAPASAATASEHSRPEVPA